MDTLDKLYQKGVSRRNFMVSAGAASAVVALAGCNNALNSSTTPPVVAAGLNDIDILTFALNLEYIEAEYYLYAATGTGLSAADAGPGAGATIAPAVTKLTGLTTAQQNILNEIAYDEQTHVQFLRSALKTAAVSRPVVDLTFFGPLALAAGITTVATGTGSFNPFTSYDNFLVGAFIFEDVGVTAYSGAAPLISAAGVTAGYLAAAAGILAVEAYHAGYVRTILTGNAISAPGTTAGTTTYAQFNAAVAVQKLRATLGGGGETTLVVPATTTAPTTIVNASAANATAYARSTDQVLHIVYGSATVGVAAGGFLPNGANFRFAKTVS